MRVMKVPFRQQASEFDCVPTSLINALSYLFNRREIPPFVVRRVYMECLDIESSRGTSRRAIQDIGFFLNNYSEKSCKEFAVKTRFLQGDQVNLRQNGKIIRCIRSNGVALVCVYLGLNSWHYVLGFRFENGWLHCYDPYPRSKKFIKNDAAVLFDVTTGQQIPNLRIRGDWLDKDFDKTSIYAERKYIFGHNDDRECLLLNRIYE